MKNAFLRNNLYLTQYESADFLQTFLFFLYTFEDLNAKCFYLNTHEVRLLHSLLGNQIPLVLSPL